MAISHSNVVLTHEANEVFTFLGKTNVKVWPRLPGAAFRNEVEV